MIRAVIMCDTQINTDDDDDGDNNNNNACTVMAIITCTVRYWWQ